MRSFIASNRRPASWRSFSSYSDDCRRGQVPHRRPYSCSSYHKPLIERGRGLPNHPFRRDAFLSIQECLPEDRGHRATYSSSSISTEKVADVAAVEVAGDSILSKYLVEQVGLEDNQLLHRDILKALESVYGKGFVRVHHLQAFGVEGLQDLARSVMEQQRQRVTSVGSQQQQRPFRMVHFTIPHHRTEFDLKWSLGESLLDIAKGSSSGGVELLGEYLEATCGGNMSCCTCHVYLDKVTYQSMSPPTDAELDMLDLAYDPQDTSRLACQVRLPYNLLVTLNNDKNTDSTATGEPTITVTIPAGVTNVWN